MINNWITKNHFKSDHFFRFISVWKKDYKNHCLHYKIGIVLQSFSNLNPMVSNKEVTHTGIVKSKTGQGIKVSIVVQSGCASCQIKGTCSMSEQSDKELDIICDPLLYHIGQHVKIKLKASQGFNALFLGYILPFVILILTMIVTSKITTNEGIIGIAAILSLIPYYSLLYIYRNKIKKKFTYVVQPLN